MSRALTTEAAPAEPAEAPETLTGPVHLNEGEDYENAAARYKQAAAYWKGKHDALARPPEPFTEEQARDRFNDWYDKQAMPQLLARVDPQQAAHNAFEFGRSLATPQEGAETLNIEQMRLSSDQSGGRPGLTNYGDYGDLGGARSPTQEPPNGHA